MDDSDVDYELVESKYPKVDKSTQTYKKLTSEGFWQNGFLVFTYKTVLQVAIAWLTLAMVGIILWHGNRLSHERLVCKHLQMLMEQNSTVFNKIAQLEEALAQSEERMSKWVEQQNPQLQTSESMKQAMETDGNVCKQKSETEQTNQKEATNETATIIEDVTKLPDDAKNQTFTASTVCWICRYGVKGQLYAPYSDNILLNYLFGYSISVVAAFCCCMFCFLFTQDPHHRQLIIQGVKGMLICDAGINVVCILLQYLVN